MTFIFFSFCLIASLIAGCGFPQEKKEQLQADTTKIGQFSLFQGEISDSNGKKTSVVFKLNSKTGETWMLKLLPDSSEWMFIGKRKIFY